MEKSQNVYNQIELRSYPFFKEWVRNQIVLMYHLFLHLFTKVKYNTLTYTVN